MYLQVTKYQYYYISLDDNTIIYNLKNIPTEFIGSLSLIIK